VLALGGEIRHAPIGRYETDYYMQRVVVATCSVAATVALLAALIPSNPKLTPDPTERPNPPAGVVTIEHYSTPPSIRSGLSVKPTIRKADFPIPKPVADWEVTEELDIGTDVGVTSWTEAVGVVGGSSPGVGTSDEWLPSRSAVAETFLFVEVPPELVSLTSPTYPELARDAGIEGIVHVKVLVSEEGFVLEALVLEGLPMLDEAAREAALSAIFRPAQQSGQPVRTWVVIPVEFVLRG
jgi:protein TonB